MNSARAAVERDLQREIIIVFPDSLNYCTVGAPSDTLAAFPPPTTFAITTAVATAAAPTPTPIATVVVETPAAAAFD
jgi:hypothetical protein